MNENEFVQIKINLSSSVGCHTNLKKNIWEYYLCFSHLNEEKNTHILATYVHCTDETSIINSMKSFNSLILFTFHKGIFKSLIINYHFCFLLKCTVPFQYTVLSKSLLCIFDSFHFTQLSVVVIFFFLIHESCTWKCFFFKICEEFEKWNKREMKTRNNKFKFILHTISKVTSDNEQIFDFIFLSNFKWNWFSYLIFFLFCCCLIFVKHINTNFKFTLNLIVFAIDNS